MKKRLKARGSAELWMSNSLSALESAGFDEIMADRSRGVITAAAEGEPIEMRIAAAGDRTEILMTGSERGMAVYKKAVAQVFAGQPVTEQLADAGLSGDQAAIADELDESREENQAPAADQAAGDVVTALDQVMVEGREAPDPKRMDLAWDGDDAAADEDASDDWAEPASDAVAEKTPDESAQPGSEALVVPAAPPSEVVVDDNTRVTAEKLKPVSAPDDQSKRAHNWIYPLIVLAVIAAAAFAAWQIGLLDGVLGKKKAAAPKKKKVVQTETTYTKVTAGDLLGQWLNDATAAEKRYEGKSLEITGVIKSIDPYGSNFKVTASDFQYGADITCWLTRQEDRDAIAKSQAGKPITVKGTIDDVGSGFGYEMKTVDSFTIGP
jgi:hypothetical protein